MKQTADLDEFMQFSREQMSKDVDGVLYVNQSNKNPEEPLPSDEDTAGRITLQMLRFVLETEGDAMYFEFPFYETAQIEELNSLLTPVYEKFPKQVISLSEIDRLVAG